MIQDLEDPSYGRLLRQMEDGGYGKGHQKAKAINTRSDDAGGIVMGGGDAGENG